MNILFDSVAQKYIYPNYYEKTIKGKGHYINHIELKKEAQNLLAGKQWLSGHFDYTFAKSIWPEANMHAFLRNPTDRIISNIHQLLNKQEKYQNHTFEEVLAEMGELMAKQQSRMLGLDYDNPDETLYNTRLDELYFLGIFEKFETSVNLLCQKHGWKLKKIKKLNPGNYTEKESHKMQVQQLLEKFPADKILYDIAVKKI